MSSTEIVAVVDGEARTTSLVIAEGVKGEHRAVLQLIRQNLADLEEFGLVAFEMRPRSEGRHGGGDVTYAVLNEQQTTLLLTYMRNSEVVRQFKKQLVRAFYNLAQQLRQPPTSPANDVALPGNYVEALEALLVREKANQALTVENAGLVPRATAWDAIASAVGDYSVGDAAKILSRAGVPTGPQRLFAQLEDIRWVYRGMDGKWRAYAERVEKGFLAEKAQFHHHPATGELVLDAPQVRVTVKGVNKLRQRLHVGALTAVVS